MRISPSDGMISIEDFKSIVIDIVAAMAERVRVAEERAGQYFQDRTNIYRCEDGRPICYCCLRVGHVAKYCWDRRFSCPHVYMEHRAPPEPSMERDNVDLQSLGRDVEKLLKELQEITKHLELSRTAPFRAEDIECESEHKTGEERKVACVEAVSHTLTPGVVWTRERHLVDTESLPVYYAKNIAPRFTDCRDVT